jgi:hypothetical protein
MLQFDGQAAILPTGPGQYSSDLTYKVSQYQGSEGVVSDISVFPAFRGPAEQLLPAFNRSNSEPIKIGSEGRITFNVADVRNPELYYASYEIYDREKRLIAAIEFPVFVSGR